MELVRSGGGGGGKNGRHGDARAANWLRGDQSHESEINLKLWERLPRRCRFCAHIAHSVARVSDTRTGATVVERLLTHL